MELKKNFTPVLGRVLRGDIREYFLVRVCWLAYFFVSLDFVQNSCGCLDFL